MSIPLLNQESCIVLRDNVIRNMAEGNRHPEFIKACGMEIWKLALEYVKDNKCECPVCVEK